MAPRLPAHDERRARARRTAVTVALAAVAVYVAFLGLAVLAQ